MVSAQILHLWYQATQSGEEGFMFQYINAKPQNQQQLVYCLLPNLT